jgi:hypothetical protein
VFSFKQGIRGSGENPPPRGSLWDVSCCLLIAVFLAAEGVYRVEATAAETASLLAAHDDGWRAAGKLSFGPSDYRTGFRALWSGAGLYLRFDAVDPDPWSTMTRRDQHLWEEEVVELFLDLDGSGTHYAEIELSPANVVCDVRMIRTSPEKEMDLKFDLAGLESRVIRREKVGWTGVMFVPWSAFRPLPSAANISLPPKPGDRWRFNVYRIERPNKKRPQEGAIFAPWSETGEEGFHVPESFQSFEFSPSGR